MYGVRVLKNVIEEVQTWCQVVSRPSRSRSHACVASGADDVDVQSGRSDPSPVRARSLRPIVAAATGAGVCTLYHKTIRYYTNI